MKTGALSLHRRHHPGIDWPKARRTDADSHLQRRNPRRILAERSGAGASSGSQASEALLTELTIVTARVGSGPGSEFGFAQVSDPLFAGGTRR
jgi:hypothetical protein